MASTTGVPTIAQKLSLLQAKPIDPSKCDRNKSLYWQIIKNSKRALDRQAKQFNLGNTLSFDRVGKLEGVSIWETPSSLPTRSKLPTFYFKENMETLHFSRTIYTKLSSYLQHLFPTNTQKNHL